MINKSITLKEIAEIAGVSIATVSYALNDKKKISPKTKTKILSIVNELNYTPNISAKNLRTAKSKLVFALVNSFSSAFNAEIIAKVESEFEQKGYQLLTVSGDIPEIIRTNIFDGGIILNYNLSSEQLTGLANLVQKKMVILSGSTPIPTASVVSMDNDQGIKSIMTEMAKSRHQRLCFIQGTITSINNQERLTSARTYYHDFFQKDDFDIRVYNGEFTTEVAYRIAKQLLEAKLYDAFVCFNDSMALGVYQAASELGLKIGQDISVIGYDNIFFGQHLTPGLTTINIDKDLWAQAIVTNYLRIDPSLNNDQAIVKIPTSLIKRESIAYR